MDGVSQGAGLGSSAVGRFADSAWLSQSLTEASDLCSLILPLGKTLCLLTLAHSKHPKTIRYFMQVND